ncbi:alpha/beta fold hydrolase [Chitinophaga nivalis]|uniref:Alpha/beta hydrolase n=1 Tax=Chitinophaga nivalis TaxID=2991709 RepID=A0ABT3IH83_9BACT|nr:alpha/beta hydrolase [Chitinophaga nivalis]MCW3466990.1 alpha/beta hydrolase [Chitinophaga nivalis]MCW3483319.1 alpha/beta hydrolase [Chitinophaga nivalis]
MERPSFKSRIYRAIIRMAGIKTKIEKEFSTGDFSKFHKAASIPEKVKSQCDVLYRTSPNGRTIWELKKKNSTPQRYIFFLHGGGFVSNITKYDWTFLNRIVQHTDVGVVVPDYPLVPASNYKDVFSMVVPAYEELVRRVGHEKVVLMGFSAGGGLAFSLAQYVRNHQMGQPATIILLSPLLDGTMQNPDIPVIDKYDPYIDINGVRKSIAIYAADTPVDDYRISPIYGTLEGLAPIHLFAGTHEVVLPDARKLVALLKEKKQAVDYYEYQQMYHAWIFLPMPEAGDVFNKLTHILK